MATGLITLVNFSNITGRPFTSVGLKELVYHFETRRSLDKCYNFAPAPPPPSTGRSASLGVNAAMGGLGWPGCWASTWWLEHQVKVQRQTTTTLYLLDETPWSFTLFSKVKKIKIKTSHCISLFYLKISSSLISFGSINHSHCCSAALWRARQQNLSCESYMVVWE